MSTGTILNVEAVQLGSDLAVVANVGDSTLTVSDAADFYEAGGYCQLNGVTYQFTTDTTGADILHLTGTVTTPGAVGDMVWVWDNQQSAIAVEYQADVAEPMSDNTGDPIRCIIDHGVFPYLPLGARNVNNGESEGCEFAETAHGRHMITSITGRANQMSTDSTAMAQINSQFNTTNGNVTTAQNTANGKNTVYYSAVAPTSGNPGVNGDIWFVYTGGTVTGMYQYQGGWVQQQLTNSVIATLDAGKITTGILAAARIGAQSVTTDKLSVGSQQAASNQVTNGSFEDGTAGWTIGNTGNGTASIVSSPGNAYTGSSMLTLNNGSSGFSYATAPNFPVRGGDTLAVSCMAAGGGGAAGNLLLVLYWYDGNGNALSSPASSSQSGAVPASAWTQLIWKVVVPTAAKFAAFQVQNSTASVSLWADDILITRADHHGHLITTPGGGNRIEMGTSGGDTINFYYGGLSSATILSNGQGLTLSCGYASPSSWAGNILDLKVTDNGTGTGGNTQLTVTPGALSFFLVDRFANQTNEFVLSGGTADFKSNTVSGNQLRSGGTTTQSSGTACYFYSNGVLVMVSSSERYKKNIRPTALDPKTLLRLEVVDYEPKNPDEDQTTLTGVIAERADELGLHHFVRYEEGGDHRPDGFHYERWTTALQHIARYHEDRLDAQDEQLEEQAMQIKELKELVTGLCR